MTPDIAALRKAFGRADMKTVWLALPALFDELESLRASQPTRDEALASRLQMRIDKMLERDGSEETAITGAGVSISYLFAKDLLRALTQPTREPEDDDPQ